MIPRPDPPRSPAQLVAHLRTGGPALVAMSGGVDSSLVASLAQEALGDSALAVTLAGPAVARSELDRARRVAEAIGIRHRVADADPLKVAAYRANDADRCYHCRVVETGELRSVGASVGVRQYVDGVHLDDLGDDRPGLRAMDAAGFTHPLVWAGWGKSEVRTEARKRALPNWDQPSDACLSSRVAHGDPISADLLARIERAEEAVRAEGFRRVRVRVRGGAARVEVDPEEVGRLSTEPLASRVVAEVARHGFAPVTIDPRGYASADRQLPVLR